MPFVVGVPPGGADNGRRAAGNPMKRDAAQQQPQQVAEDDEAILLPTAKRARADTNHEAVEDGLASESSLITTQDAPALTLPLPLTPSKQQQKAKTASLHTTINKPNHPKEEENALHVLESSRHENHPNIHHTTTTTTTDQPSDFAGGAEAWNAMLFQLVLFKSQHTHVNVRHDDSNHRSLYQWVQTQRRHYKLYHNHTNHNATPASSSTCSTNGATTVPNNAALHSSSSSSNKNNTGFLTEDRIAVLNAIHFRWNIRGDQNWKRNYDDLTRFKAANGHCLVPRLYGDNLRLGEWVTEQRRQYKALCPDETSTETSPTKRDVVDEDHTPLVLEGEVEQEDVSKTMIQSKKVALSLLTPDRIALLNDIGFVWKVRDRTNWDCRYQQLLDYKEDNDGSVNVPQHYAANKSLGKWVAKQREQYRLKALGKHSFLNADRIELLNQVGFVWAIKGTRSKAALLRAANKDFPMTTTTTTTTTGTTPEPMTTEVDVAVAEETTNTKEESTTAEDQQQLPIFSSMDEHTTDAIETDPVVAEGVTLSLEV